MYNYFGTPSVPEETVERLEALEQELQVPIRIVSWGRAARDNQWGTGTYDGFDHSLAREQGITIALGARAENEYLYLYADDAGSYYYGVSLPRDRWDITLESPFGIGTPDGYSPGTQVWGDIQEEPRVINSWIQLTSHYSDRWLPYTTQLWDVIIAAIEENFGGPSLTDEEREAARAARQQAMFDRYVERVYNNQIQARRQAIDEHTRLISQAQTTIARETAALITDQELLDALIMVQEHDSASTMRSEFEQLSSHARLASKSISGNTLTLVTTDDLRLTREDTGESRWLGAFEIKFNLETFGINIRNLNTMRGGRHHPHITGDGQPCFGSYANSFYELLGRGQLYVCFDLLIQYIESVNLRDEWGRYASYWFEQPDERPLDTDNEADEATTEELVTA